MVSLGACWAFLFWCFWLARDMTTCPTDTIRKYLGSKLLVLVVDFDDPDLNSVRVGYTQ